MGNFLVFLLQEIVRKMLENPLNVLILIESTWNDSYLVDPASSHMLVSKLKPCTCKYQSILYFKLRIAH